MAIRFILPTGAVVYLTRQELAVLNGLACSASNRDIAASLSVVEKTVKNYTNALFQALGVRNRTEAVMVAMWANIVIPPLPPRMPDRLTRWQRDKLRRGQRS